MADTLRNGILEEDSKQNPNGGDPAISGGDDGIRRGAADCGDALFRMAECYRKQGNRRRRSRRISEL